jgi:hypothetical protein
MTVLEVIDDLLSHELANLFLNRRSAGAWGGEPLPVAEHSIAFVGSVRISVRATKRGASMLFAASSQSSPESRGACGASTDGSIGQGG